MSNSYSEDILFSEKVQLIKRMQ